MITKPPMGLNAIYETFGNPNDVDFERENIVTFDLPYPLAYDGRKVMRSRCHKLAVDNFVQALMEIDHAGLASEVTNYAGIYAQRTIRGRSKPSTHSWGIAIDVEPEKYPLGSLARLPQPVVDIFTRAGFTYGGDFKSRKDPMHFQLCSNY